MDPEFLEKINPTFLCLTTAILCHALRCWQTGLFIDEVNFTRSNLQGNLADAEAGQHREAGHMATVVKEDNNSTNS